MVDFKEALRKSRRNNMKIFRMDDEGHEYWAGITARQVYDHWINVTGIDPEESPFDQVHEMSPEEMLTWKIGIDTDEEVPGYSAGDTITFRQFLDKLIDLGVDFPRPIGGSEE